MLDFKIILMTFWKGLYKSTCLLMRKFWRLFRLGGRQLGFQENRSQISLVNQWFNGFLEQALKANLINEVVIATDDKRIYDVVLDFGGKAVMTSPNHQSGTDRVAEVVRNIECDIVVNVQGDEPLIPSENIDLVIKPLLDSDDLSSVDTYDCYS